MRLITSVKNFFVYSLVLLITVCSLLLTPPNALAASVDFGATQYIAFDTTASISQIDELIAYYREQKLWISKNENLSIDARKEILKEINSEINALIKDKKALLPTNVIN